MPLHHNPPGNHDRVCQAVSISIGEDHEGDGSPICGVQGGWYLGLGDFDRASSATCSCGGLCRQFLLRVQVRDWATID